ERRLLQVRENHRRPTEAADSVPLLVDVARREDVVGAVIVVQGPADLLQVIRALRPACRLDSRQEQGDEYADDGDDHQQLEEREAAVRRGGAGHRRGAFLPGRARGFTSAPRSMARCRWSASVPARMLVAEASEQSLDGQVFWLAARGGPRAP